jgi:hypothetical protein
MFCSKCGSENLDGSQFCAKCGTAITSGSVAVGNLSERKRHGFTSFWLIFLIVGYLIGGSIYLFAPQVITQYWNASNGLIMLYGIATIAGIIGIVLLLCWKKIGFWIIIGLSIVSIFLNVAIGMNIGQNLWGVVGVVVLFGVLHIRKNGKTTWSQLE